MGNGHKLNRRRLPLRIRKQFFHCDDDQVLAQVAQARCEVFILGDAQKLSGCGPEQPTLGGPA